MKYQLSSKYAVSSFLRILPVATVLTFLCLMKTVSGILKVNLVGYSHMWYMSHSNSLLKSGRFARSSID